MNLVVKYTKKKLYLMWSRYAGIRRTETETEKFVLLIVSLIFFGATLFVYLPVLFATSLSDYYNTFVENQKTTAVFGIFISSIFAMILLIVYLYEMRYSFSLDYH